MTDNEYISMLQKDPLYREFPGPSGEGLVGKLVVAVVLGLVLAAVGGLTDARRDHASLSQIDAPWTAPPPAIVVEGKDRRALAAR